MEIRGKSISYASFKKKTRNKQEEELISQIQNIENNLSEDLMPKLETLKTELYNLREEKMQGFLVRSRANIIENGEKPTNYFCNLETHNYTNKIINIVEKENGEILVNQKDILNEVRNYYENLYSSKDSNLEEDDLKTYMENCDTPTLDINESLLLEGSLTLEEASQFLKKMQNNKSPGTSGFSADFFKVFWGQLGSFVVRAINYGFSQGELSITQQQGLIVCIPKENKPRNFLKNWRPITLLNTVYKIASGSIANRIKTVLDKLIHKDQSGFITGRFIGENIRLIYDLLHFTEEHNIPGLLLLIDFEKAFDSVSWSFIDKVLKLFNFGPFIRNWIKVMYKNATSAVTQCGVLSPFFKLGRGCRQGDPISPYLFILCAEILSIRIRKNRNINGIKIGDEELKISQFADDTSMILDGTETSLSETLNELSGFENMSGLKINFSKTQVVWIGLKKYSTDSIKTRWKLSWGATQFKLLGITFDVDLSKMVQLNYTDRIHKMKNKISNWDKRALTPLGKITVIKSLLLPMITHLILSLPNPEFNMIKDINNMFYDFLWHGRAKIKQSVVVKQYFEGGLKMINLNAFVDALKITWVRRLIQWDNNWQVFIKHTISVEKLLSCGSEYIKEIYNKTNNEFWKDVFKALSKFDDSVDSDMVEQNFPQTPIFYNRYLHIAGKSFFYKTWFQKGIRFIKDLITDHGTFYDLEAFVESTRVRTNFLQYQGVIQCIKQFLQEKNVLLNYNINSQEPFTPKPIGIILKQKKGSQNIYNILNKNEEIPTGKLKWNQLYDIDDKTWESIFVDPFQITQCSKLRWFQLTINHKITVTNNFLSKAKLIDSPLCTLCGESEETIQHIFWYCQKTQIFLKDLELRFQRNNIQLKLSEKSFILGTYPKGTSDILQFLMLIAKYCIYICRCTKRPLNFNLYKNNVQSMYKIQKEIAINNNELQTFLQNWHIFQNVII